MAASNFTPQQASPFFAEGLAAEAGAEPGAAAATDRDDAGPEGLVESGAMACTGAPATCAGAAQLLQGELLGNALIMMSEKNCCLLASIATRCHACSSCCKAELLPQIWVIKYTA